MHINFSSPSPGGRGGGDKINFFLFFLSIVSNNLLSWAEKNLSPEFCSEYGMRANSPGIFQTTCPWCYPNAYSVSFVSQRKRRLRVERERKYLAYDILVLSRLISSSNPPGSPPGSPPPAPKSFTYPQSLSWIDFATEGFFFSYFKQTNK